MLTEAAERTTITSKQEQRRVHGDLDVFASYEDALKGGFAKFGNVPFFIKEISREEDVNFFYTYPIR